MDTVIFGVFFLSILARIVLRTSPFYSYWLQAQLGWYRSYFRLDVNYSLSNAIYALVSKGNLGQYCEYLSQHIVFSCQPQL